MSKKRTKPIQHCGKWVLDHSYPGCTVSKRCRRPPGHTGPCMGITVNREDQPDPKDEKRLETLYQLGIETLALVIQEWMQRDERQGINSDPEQDRDLYLNRIRESILEQMKKG